MLTLAQLESHRCTVSKIHQYEALLESYAVPNAVKIDLMPNASSPDPHRIENLILRVETAKKELPRLKVVAEAFEEDAKRAISEITGGNLRLALVFRMRFLSDHDWHEIEHMLHVKNPERLVKDALVKAHKDLED